MIIVQQTFHCIRLDNIFRQFLATTCHTDRNAATNNQLACFFLFYFFGLFRMSTIAQIMRIKNKQADNAATDCRIGKIKDRAEEYESSPPQKGIQSGQWVSMIGK